MWNLLSNRRRPYSLDYRLRMADGNIRHLHESAVLVEDRSGNPIRVHGTTQDVTERMRLEGKIRRQATYDDLTGLPNRILFHDRFKRALARCERGDEHLALLFLDLDGFKQINDTFGHETGD